MKSEMVLPSFHPRPSLDGTDSSTLVSLCLRYLTVIMPVSLYRRAAELAPRPVRRIRMPEVSGTIYRAQLLAGELVAFFLG